VFWATLTLSPLADEGGTNYVAVSRDTTAAKEYEQMLERQNDRLKEFTDILAHDLRNPLNVIDGRLELYEETGDEAHLETIHETTSRMERLVDDLLRVARQGVVVANPEATDIGTVIETAWGGGTGKTTDATLDYEAVPTVSADSDRLVELFENLFRNAVEHGSTNPGSRTRQDAEEHGSTSNRPEADDAVEHAGAAVSVDGPGIPDEHEDEVFEHGFTTAQDGSGYGLSVVRTIGNAHGWDVSVADAADGGARFEITGIDFLY
jgi:signal transduction histidine kinase